MQTKDAPHVVKSKSTGLIQVKKYYLIWLNIRLHHYI